MFIRFNDALLLILQCSRSCNGGSQTRSVMCFDHKGQTSRYCSSKDKPFHYQHCNTKPCPTSRGRVAQFKPCNDIYSHGICFYVTQANFCRYSHYNHMCCNSCQRRRHWHNLYGWMWNVMDQIRKIFILKREGIYLYVYWN